MREFTIRRQSDLEFDPEYEDEDGSDPGEGGEEENQQQQGSEKEHQTIYRANFGKLYCFYNTRCYNMNILSCNPNDLRVKRERKTSYRVLYIS